MGPPPVVVAAIPGEDGPQVPFTEDQDAIGQLGSDGQDGSFGEAVRSGTSRRDLDGVDPRRQLGVDNLCTTVVHLLGKAPRRPLLLAAPGLILPSQRIEQTGDRVIEAWTTGAVRVVHLGDQAAMPPQERSWGDQAVTAQQRGQVPDQHGQHSSVGPVQSGLAVGSAEYGDLVAEDEQHNVFGSRGAAEQQPADKSIEDQVKDAKRHVRDRGPPLD
jgi:hypothetical protein